MSNSPNDSENEAETPLSDGGKRIGVEERKHSEKNLTKFFDAYFLFIF